MGQRSGRTLWLALAVVAGGGGFAAWRWLRPGEAAVTYRTALLTRGDLLSSIAATGTLEPEEAVDVGAQVAGQIARFGTEDGKPVDRRSFVKKGDLLAEIDPSLYRMDLESAEAQLAGSRAQLAQNQAQLAQSDAQLSQCDAGVAKAQADLEQAEAKRVQAEEDWNRAQRLRKEGPEALAESAYDGYRAAFLSGVANVAASRALKAQAEASIVQAKAGRGQALAAIDQASAAIQQALAAVDRARRNLDYCTISSPVDGVVIDRRVNIGQTVVSSLNAPSLFLIAKDLTRMQIWVSVNEADIGSVREGQPVLFNVDARPGVSFKGTVTKVRFDATMTQNVVTYPVEVLALNPDGLLYPYMTANVRFEVDRRTNVLRAPGAALRYAPPTVGQVAPEARSGLEALAGGGGASGPASPAAGGTKGAGSGAREGHRSDDRGLLWIRKGAFVVPVPVRAGLSDGTMTEVEGAGLQEGLEVVVSEEWQSAGPEGGAPSPFVPQVRRR